MILCYLYIPYDPFNSSFVFIFHLRLSINHVEPHLLYERFLHNLYFLKVVEGVGLAEMIYRYNLLLLSPMVTFLHSDESLVVVVFCWSRSLVVVLVP